MTTKNFRYRQATIEDLPAIADLEKESYPEDEAASFEALKYRLQNAPKYFLLRENTITNSLEGFICSTLSPTNELKEESMSSHDASGKFLCIHSVVIHPSIRRTGAATQMLAHYLSQLQLSKAVLEVLLIAKAYLVPLYEKAGFTVLRPSPVVHGKDPWLEMSITF